MRMIFRTLAAFAFAFSSVPAQSAEAQGNPPPATATRPSPTGPEQTSVPGNAPAAARKQTNQDPTIKQMNDSAKSKVEREGK